VTDRLYSRHRGDADVNQSVSLEMYLLSFYWQECHKSCAVHVPISVIVKCMLRLLCIAARWSSLAV